MATPPNFSAGAVLTAAQMSAVGMWLVKTVTVGSGASSVPITSAFSADFDMYRITYNGGTASANSELVLTLGSTVSGYYNTVLYGAWSSSPTAAAAGTGSTSSFSFAGVGDPDGNFLDLSIMNPYLTKRTAIYGAFVGLDSDRVGGYTTGFLANTTSYTGCTISATGGATLTGGTIRVYGIRN
jgi:hypothetical protein